MSNDEIDLGPVTAKETAKRLSVQPSVKEKEITKNTQKVVESIRKWKENPLKGRTIYRVQSKRYPFEPDRAFYERVAALLKKDGYFYKFEDGDLCNGTPKYHWFKIALKPFPEEEKQDEQEKSGEVEWANA